MGLTLRCCVQILKLGLPNARYVYTIPGAALVAFCRKSLQGREGGTSVGAPDVPAMAAAAASLVGTRDFAALQSKGGRSTTVRTLYRCDVTGGAGGASLRVTAEGDGFLYNMMRILVGTLLEVGCGLRTLEETQMLAPLAPAERAATEQEPLRPTRAMAGPTLPPFGLTLEHVEYDAVWSPQVSASINSAWTVANGADSP